MMMMTACADVMEAGDSQLQSAPGRGGYMVVAGGSSMSSGRRQHQQDELTDSERAAVTTTQPAEHESVPRTRSLRTSLLAFSKYPHGLSTVSHSYRFITCDNTGLPHWAATSIRHCSQPPSVILWTSPSRRPLAGSSPSSSGLHYGLSW